MPEIKEATAVALAEMKVCRQALINLGAAYGRDSGICRESHQLAARIDAMAEMLTGKSEYFCENDRSTSGPTLRGSESWSDHMEKPPKS